MLVYRKQNWKTVFFMSVLIACLALSAQSAPRRASQYSPYDSAPAATDAVPAATDAIPAATDAVPAATDAVPAAKDAAPAAKDAVPAATDAAPAAKDAAPAATDAVPAATDAVPAATDAAPAATDAAPAATDAVPAATDVAPAATDAVPAATDAVPAAKDAAPAATDAAPAATDAAPAATDAVPAATDAAPAATDAVPAATDAAPAAKDAAPAATDAAPAATDVAPAATDAAPAATDAAPAATDAAPAATDAAPAATDAAPAATDAAPAATDAAPAATGVAPAATDAVPAATDVAPAATDAAPAATDAAPAAKDVAPAATGVAPAATGAASAVLDADFSFQGMLQDREFIFENQEPLFKDYDLDKLLHKIRTVLEHNDLESVKKQFHRLFDKESSVVYSCPADYATLDENFKIAKEGMGQGYLIREGHNSLADGENPGSMESYNQESPFEEMDDRSQKNGERLQVAHNLLKEKEGRLQEIHEESNPAELQRSEDDSLLSSKTPLFSPKTLYKKGYDFILSGNYVKAEKAFCAFQNRYQKDPLSNDALFWLAEALLGQKRYHEAAQVYLNVWYLDKKKLYTSEILLKLAISMVALGHNEEACVLFAKRPKSSKTPKLSKTLECVFCKPLKRERRHSRCSLD
ncbi:tol-pal system protein [Bartonella gliris]|uniref:tol-pal system protein n=1 Tax=Bartonella gliris TaxID=3004109 RepID=UPI0038732CAE